MKTVLFILVLVCNYSMAQTNNCNCCTENHQAFDFWIGDWVVTNSDGSKAGENSIQKAQDNCVLIEQWTSAKGNYSGTSQNFYNQKTKQWEQLWIDNQGAYLKLKGHKKANQMIMRTDDEVNSEGKSFYHRITWTNNADGTVRQLWETITEGENVSVAFDGLYKRKTKR
ncbi:hypothetical protein [Psychroserpens sp. SPM9]|uniref:hypothetical protein n=1 Tax=Psychroserpens sp. SPM9 TaxID=2975598 RepID=UPI0021A54662|nr:hypothetical protein [Psychroserpens sp. SPM9]MDG5492574.1 hypothetical protein [Psychroserpens sp. SPM9]